ncbi:hypothetical protein EJ03DRAFT_70886 [Teratosphaeria nubilosa]|uniref:Uncharacterized protein n=1 Tax=Teratosphaeria nubilosa TaxID=161662 RepID=A0A6G1LLU7_9PEZI|nr:hypothetical protein EJ03DRAFT_70886 [Teratosphaeria nubilosa]
MKTSFFLCAAGFDDPCASEPYQKDDLAGFFAAEVGREDARQWRVVHGVLRGMVDEVYHRVGVVVPIRYFVVERRGGVEDVEAVGGWG